MASRCRNGRGLRAFPARTMTSTAFRESLKFAFLLENRVHCKSPTYPLDTVTSSIFAMTSNVFKFCQGFRHKNSSNKFEKDKEISQYDFFKSYLNQVSRVNFISEKEESNFNLIGKSSPLLNYHDTLFEDQVRVQGRINDLCDNKNHDNLRENNMFTLASDKVKGHDQIYELDDSDCSVHGDKIRGQGHNFDHKDFLVDGYISETEHDSIHDDPREENESVRDDPLTENDSSVIANKIDIYHLITDIRKQEMSHSDNLSSSEGVYDQNASHEKTNEILRHSSHPKSKNARQVISETRLSHFDFLKNKLLKNPTETDLSRFLKNLGVKHKISAYKEKSLRRDSKEIFCKNLLLKDRRGKYFYLICNEDKTIDMKKAAKILGAHRNVSFASASDTDSLLQLQGGGITPFALMNETASCIYVAITTDLLEDESRLMNFHPFEASLTLSLTLNDLQKYLSVFNHTLQILPI